MNKYLVFILVFIVVIPVLALQWVGYSLPHCIEKNTTCYEYMYLIRIFTFYFLFVGGFFLISYLRVLGSTQQKVSFVNQVSHELKTPITNMMLYVDLLKDRLDGDMDALKKLEVLDLESRRLERLVSNILTFSYGDDVRLVKKDEDVDALLEQIVESFRPLLEQVDLKVVLELKAGQAKIDKSVIEQVLANLISNAEKYASSGTTLTIKAFKRDSSIFIHVCDDGPGIPENLREEVFAPFARGDDRLVEGVSGIGIGLTLSANLMQAHGGHLKLMESNKGTCFEVMF